jgi:hypothetical protein
MCSNNCFVLVQIDELGCGYATSSDIQKINLEDDVPKKAKVSKAMRAYLERARQHGKFVHVSY